MIIDAKTIVITLIIVAVTFVAGLRFVRSFALSIAQENHDANLALDQEAEEKRQKQERNADAAAASAFAKVEPLLTVPTPSKTTDSVRSTTPPPSTGAPAASAEV